MRDRIQEYVDELYEIMEATQTGMKDVEVHNERLSCLIGTPEDQADPTKAIDCFNSMGSEYQKMRDRCDAAFGKLKDMFLRDRGKSIRVSEAILDSTPTLSNKRTEDK